MYSFKGKLLRSEMMPWLLMPNSTCFSALHGSLMQTGHPVHLWKFKQQADRSSGQYPPLTHHKHRCRPRPAMTVGSFCTISLQKHLIQRFLLSHLFINTVDLTLKQTHTCCSASLFNCIIYILLLFSLIYLNCRADEGSDSLISPHRRQFYLNEHFL